MGQQSSRTKPLIYWVLLALFALSGLGGALYYAKSLQDREIAEIVTQTADQQGPVVFSNIQARLNLIAGDLAEIFRHGAPQNQDEHAQLTRHLIAANPFITSLNYISPERRIQFVTPYAANKKIVGLKISLDAPKDAMEKAQQSGVATLSRPFAIIQGSLGYSVMMPAPSGGFFEFVFLTDAVFGGLIGAELSSSFNFEIRDGKSVVYRSPRFLAENMEFEQYSHKLELTMMGRTFQLTVIPKRGLISNQRQFWKTLLFALLFFVFLSLVLSSVLMARLIDTERKANLALEQARLEAERLARIDMLTGLPNRRSFAENGAMAFRTSRRYNHRLSALMMDIDHFKWINDSYGHHAGDEVLIAVAEILRTWSRNVDLLGRVGGEEFALLLPETDEEDAVVFAERLREKIAALRVSTEEKDITLTCSIGVTVCDEKCNNLDELLNRADRALYQAKRNGRDHVEVYRNEPA